MDVSRQAPPPPPKIFDYKLTAYLTVFQEVDDAVHRAELER